jgi:hypothetical protein
MGHKHKIVVLSGYDTLKTCYFGESFIRALYYFWRAKRAYPGYYTRWEWR